MNAVRVDTGKVSEHEKGGFVISDSVLGYSVAAEHSHHFHSSQHNEPETSKLRRRGRERERQREGDQSVESN